MKNMAFKIMITIQTLIIITFAIVAWSPTAYHPVLVATSTLDFANTAAGSATDLTVTVTGAVDGDPVMIGVPNGSTSGNGDFSGWVSSANTVTVRFINPNLLTALDPASGSFKLLVFKR